MQRRTVVFDFDGTLALGRGPLNAYAACLGELTTPQVAAACQAAIERFDTGQTAYRDAYDAVRVAALEFDVPAEHLSTAYLRSRELLATDAAPIHPPAGLAEFLNSLRPAARCVLATNAPDIGIDRSLDVLGITDLIDERHTSVGKPAGLEPIISSHLTDGPTLAVGDIWENDLAPADVLGATTALVGVSTTGHPTMRGATLTDLYDHILRWTTQTRSPEAEPATTGHSSERQI